MLASTICIHSGILCLPILDSGAIFTDFFLTAMYLDSVRPAFEALRYSQSISLTIFGNLSVGKYIHAVHWEK